MCLQYYVQPHLHLLKLCLYRDVLRDFKKKNWEKTPNNKTHVPNI